MKRVLPVQVTRNGAMRAFICGFAIAATANTVGPLRGSAAIALNAIKDLGGIVACVSAVLAFARDVDGGVGDNVERNGWFAVAGGAAAAGPLIFIVGDVTRIDIALGWLAIAIALASVVMALAVRHRGRTSSPQPNRTRPSDADGFDRFDREQ